MTDKTMHRIAALQVVTPTDRRRLPSVREKDGDANYVSRSSLRFLDDVSHTIRYAWFLESHEILYRVHRHLEAQVVSDLDREVLLLLAGESFVILDAMRRMDTARMAWSRTRREGRVTA